MNSFYKYILLLGAYLYVFNISSQGEGNNWYFGNYAGLNFSTNPPTLLTDSHLQTYEGCAAVSGKDGNLAFYTDGRTVWDALHNVFPNGNGDLMGNPSSVQSAVICPKPGTYDYTKQRYNNYYIVTVEVKNGVSLGGSNAGVRYTEVNMNLNGGMGDVVTSNKNIHLFGTTTIEGANVAKHANGCDYWIIGKEVGTTNIRTYLVTSAGVSLTPVISTAISTGVAIAGSIKVSSNNKLISITNIQSTPPDPPSAMPSIEIYDFNNSTGVLTQKFNTVLNYAYSSEFSPNNNLLYVTELGNSDIYQFDLTATSVANFNASKTAIGTTANTVNYKVCSIQLAPNNKIYIALEAQERLGVINNPDVVGVGCNYDDNGQPLTGVSTFSNEPIYSILGLPAFPSFFIQKETSIISSYLCNNDQTKLKLSDTSDVDNVKWYWSPLGTTLPAIPNSTAWEPITQFSNAGSYRILAIANYTCFIDSIYDTISITAINSVNLGNDTTLCEGETLSLDVEIGYDYYLWHNGNDTQTFLADTAGKYFVEVSNIGENLIVNGDFENGNSSFSSEYVESTPYTIQGQYQISNNTEYGACTDHTSGSGFMLDLDGNTIPNTKVWCQEISVTPDTDYEFSSWFLTTVSSNPAILQFSINGVNLGGVINLSSATCVWNEYKTTWNSGTETNIEICIVNQNTIASGNDFAIDDIKFSPLCKTSDTINITVGEIPMADFSVADDCLNTAAQFTDNSSIVNGTISNWEWSFGDATPIDTIQNPSHLYSIDSTYEPQLIVTSDFGCKDTVVKQTVRHAVPNLDFNAPNVCVSDSIALVNNTTINSPSSITNYIWNFGDGSAFSTSQYPKHKYLTDGIFNVSLIATSNYGCVENLSIPVQVYPKPVANFYSNSVCENDPPLTFTDLSSINVGSLNSWEWDFGNGNTSTLRNPSNQYTMPGLYNVQLITTSNHNCKDTIIFPRTVKEKPTANFIVDITEGCSPVCVNFTDNSISNATSINQWEWFFGNGEQSFNQAPSTICYENTSNTNDASYNVSLVTRNDNGCYDTILKNNLISSWYSPLAEFEVSPLEINMYEGEVTVINTSVGANTYSWNFENSSTSTEFEPTTVYSDTGTYNIVLAVANQYNCVDTVNKQVTITPVISLYIPNSFTPNGDGKNDTFIYKGFGIDVSTVQLSIFDRWGEQIYYTENGTPWDGTHKSQLAVQGSYAYLLTCIDLLGKEHEYTGHLFLLR